MTDSKAERLSVLGDLPSKKNNVCRVQWGSEVLVIKRFATPEAAAVEQTLRQRAAAAGLAVPAAAPVLATVYQDAPTLLDLLEVAEERLARHATTVAAAAASLSVAWQALFRWLVAFHEATGHIVGDVNARNFLYDAQAATLYGLDFEDARPGAPEEDVGRALAFLLNYDPVESPLKRAVCDDLRARLAAGEIEGLQYARIEAFCRDEQAAIQRRRAVRPPVTEGNER